MSQRATGWNISILGLFVALLAGVGCDDGGGGLGGNQVGAEVDAPAFAVVGAEDAFANVEDATLAEPLSMNDPLAAAEFDRHPRHPHHRGSHLRQLLRSLGISPSQMGDIRAVVRDHREVVRPVFQELREANQELIDAARLERQLILDDLAAGDLTEDEARALLKQLSDATRQAIRDNPDNAPFLQAICEARQQLFASIRLLLDDGQQLTFDDWVAGLGGDCFS